MIAAELRRAILAAAGRPDADPNLRPGPAPGTYASPLPLALGRDPRAAAASLAAKLAREPWIARAEVTGQGYLTVQITHEALATLAPRIAQAGLACASSDALRGHTIPVPPHPSAEPTWPQARATLAAHLTARLATAAGATPSFSPERSDVPPSGKAPQSPPEPAPAADTGLAAESGPVADAIRYAGADEVRFSLARMSATAPPPEPAVIARHVLANPAYAVRYAHAAAVAVLRWAAELGIRPAGFRWRLLTEPGELALLDALSWLPERVAVAARRGRPDEFAGYLEELAALTIDTMNTTGFIKVSTISSERLWLADAARTGLAAGLGLLGVSAPSRL